MRGINWPLCLWGCFNFLTTQAQAEAQLTADSLECNQQTQQCIARGNAKVTNDQGIILEAPSIIAHFTRVSPQRHLTFQSVEAKQGIVLTNQEGEKISGEQGQYNLKTGEFVIEGKVHLTQPPNVFTGDTLKGNLKQGVFSLSSKKTPVKALLYQEKSKS